MKGSRRIKGFTLLELGIFVAVLAIVGAAIAVNWGGVQSGIRVERAYSEVERIKTAAATYRGTSAQRGLYTNLAVQRLSDRGYNVEPFTSGTSQNAYGLTVAIAPAVGATDATLTYQLDNDDDCNQLIDRYTNVTGVKTTPTCPGAASLFTFTMTIE